MPVQRQWGDGDLPVPKQVATARCSCHPAMLHFFQKLSQLCELNVHRLNTANATSAVCPTLLTPSSPKTWHPLSVETAPWHWGYEQCSHGVYSAVMPGHSHGSTSTPRVRVQPWIFLWACSSPKLGPRLVPDLFNCCDSCVMKVNCYLQLSCICIEILIMKVRRLARRVEFGLMDYLIASGWGIETLVP